MKYYVQIPLHTGLVEELAERLAGNYEISFQEAWDLLSSMSDINLVIDNQRISGHTRRV